MNIPVKRVALIIVAVAELAGATCPDYTDKLEYLCNPNASVQKWQGTNLAKRVSRTTMSIYPFKGRLYTSGGEWNANTGPCPIFTVNPEDGAFTNHFAAGTETIWYFREDSAGRLYAAGVDQKEGSKTRGAYFRMDTENVWTNLLTVPNGSITNLGMQGYSIHTWDLCCWKGKVFTAGYGIASCPEGSNDRMTDATPDLRDCRMLWKGTFNLVPGPNATNKEPKMVERTMGMYRRFYSFFPFEDDLYCYPMTVGGTNFNHAGIIEEWRYDERHDKFVCQTNRLANLIPDGRNSDTNSIRTSNIGVLFWHATPFKGRVLYIVGNESQRTHPWYACSATNDNHTVVATRIGLEEDEYPFCLAKGDGKALLLAARPDGPGMGVVNTVLESEDGLSFNRKFFFRTRQPALAVALMDGTYYFGMGAGYKVEKSWRLPENAEEDGAVYRLRP
jgi:hypothetical protein